eukprot:3225358-Pyramimonas_sp.AAC.1
MSLLNSLLPSPYHPAGCRRLEAWTETARMRWYTIWCLVGLLLHLSASSWVDAVCTLPEYTHVVGTQSLPDHVLQTTCVS